jgi:diaminopimelate decarboxylase
MDLTTDTGSRVLPLGSRVNEAGRLEIGGCDVVEVAREHGTPCYVVAEDDMRARARAYLEAFRARHEDFDVLFASKAFPCTAAYRVLAEEGLACDVASGGELHLALRGGFDPERIYLHGNAKSDAELRMARESGVGHVVIDSQEDIGRLERLVGQGRQRVLIRVTPGVRAATHAKISTGQVDSKFGLGLDAARHAIARVRASDCLELVGLHIHIGSQIFDLEPFHRAVEAIANLGEFPVYNLGGGLGVAYTEADRPPSIEEYVQAKVHAAHELLGSDKRLLIEPGRSLVANSGVTLYSVVSVKRNASTWVAVDGGMSDNLRPMLYGSRYEAWLAEPGEGRAGAGDRYRLVGKHCESGDVLIPEAVLSRDPRTGEIVLTPATGAYGHAMANNYNGIPRPPVVFCRRGEARVVVRRETYEDLSARDVV